MKTVSAAVKLSAVGLLMLGLAAAQDGKITPSNLMPANTLPTLIHGAPVTPAPVLNTAAPVNSLPQGGYVLTSWTDEGGQMQPLGTHAPTLQLDGKRASGNAGCNRYGGAYLAREGYLRFGAMTSTLMACDPALLSQESRYLKLLGQVRGFTLSGNTLTLLVGAKGRLVYRQQAGQGEVSGGGIKSNLNGNWKFVNATARNGNAGINPARSEMNFTIRGSEISGNDGCNQFQGHVSFSGGVLKLVGPVTATRMACPPENLSLYTMLGDGVTPSQGAGYQVRGNTLTLSPLAANQGEMVWHFEKK